MYPIQMSAFQGPLDLLLYLIERQELEITAVSLSEVTQQYLEALHTAQDLSANALAEFILVAAKLCYIKSTHLLPRPLLPTPQEEDTGDDLVAMLLEYKKFKAATAHFRSWEERGWRSYLPLAPFIPPPTGLPEGLKLEDLAQALERALARQKQLPQERIEPLAFRLEDKMAELEQSLAQHGRLSFGSMLARASSRREMVAAFLALLELLRQGKVRVSQRHAFADILLTLV